MREAIEGVARDLDVPARLLADALDYLTPHTADGVAAQIAALERAIGTTRTVEWPNDDDRFQLLALLGAVPAARAWMLARGVSGEIATTSLADLTPKLRDYGIHATGVDWLAKVVTCRVFTLGRLQFEPGVVVPGSATPAFDVHVPESGPLDPASCDASFAAARRFFADTFGDVDTRDFICQSWLLDDQLAAYLPGDSNILDFQRRFDLLDTETTDAPVDDPTDGDRAVAKFIFRAPVASLLGITPKSTLERAVLEHLAAGRHWRERVGVLRRA